MTCDKKQIPSTQQPKIRKRELLDLVFISVPLSCFPLPAENLTFRTWPKKQQPTKTKPSDFIPCDDEFNKPYLVLYHEGEHLPEHDFSECLCNLRHLELLLPPELEQPALPEIDSLRWSLGSTRIGQRYCITLQNPDFVALNAFISRTIDLFLIYGRPLAFYRCAFFFPIPPLEFDLEPIIENYRYPVREGHSTNQNTSQQEKNEAQAYSYFSPGMRDLLFDCARHRQEPSKHGLEPIKEWRLNESHFKGWQLKLENADKDGTDNAYFTSITLYRYFNGIYLLGFALQPVALKTLSEPNAKLLKQLSDKTEHIAREHF